MQERERKTGGNEGWDEGPAMTPSILLPLHRGAASEHRAKRRIVKARYEKRDGWEKQGEG